MTQEEIEKKLQDLGFSINKRPAQRFAWANAITRTLLGLGYAISEIEPQYFSFTHATRPEIRLNIDGGVRLTWQPENTPEVEATILPETRKAILATLEEHS